MESISTFEATPESDSLIAQVDRDEEATITRNGKAILVLHGLPVATSDDEELAPPRGLIILDQRKPNEHLVLPDLNQIPLK